MIIDPLNPKAEQLPILVTILEDLKANSNSGIDTSSIIPVLNPEQTSATLTYIILKRQNKRNDDVRFEVIDFDTTMGAGSCGAVFPVLATLKLVDKKIQKKLKFLSKQRIVKAQPLVEDGAQTRFTLEKEYRVAALTPHLRPKKPIDFAGLSWMVMRRIEGKSFFEVILRDTNNTPVFSLQQRFTMTLELLLTFDEQVATLGIVHRDLKPENIIYDDKSRKFGIIDYGFAKLEKEPTKENCGTISYSSPENLVENPHITQASDIYSLGRVIGLIWHNHTWPGYHIHSHSAKSLREMQKHLLSNDYSELFKDILELESEAANSVRCTLANMTTSQPHRRISLKTAVEQFRQAFKLQFPDTTLVFEKKNNYQIDTLARPVRCKPLNPPKSNTNSRLFQVKKEESETQSVRRTLTPNLSSLFFNALTIEIKKEEIEPNPSVVN